MARAEDINLNIKPPSTRPEQTSIPEANIPVSIDNEHLRIDLDQTQIGIGEGFEIDDSVLLHHLNRSLRKSQAQLKLRKHTDNIVDLLGQLRNDIAQASAALLEVLDSAVMGSGDVGSHRDESPGDLHNSSSSVGMARTPDPTEEEPSKTRTSPEHTAGEKQ